MLLTCFLALRIFHELLHSFDTVHPRRTRGLWTGIGCRRLDHHLARYPSPSVNSESSLHGDRVYTIKISTYLLLPCLHPWCPVTESQSLKRKGRRGKHRTGSNHQTRHITSHCTTVLTHFICLRLSHGQTSSISGWGVRMQWFPDAMPTVLWHASPPVFRRSREGILRHFPADWKSSPVGRILIELEKSSNSIYWLLCSTF